MKATKLLCGIAAMALAFAACNKVEQPATDNGNLKSVFVKFDNIDFITKADAGNAIKNGDDIFVSSIQVFFTDGTKLYLGKDATGAPASHRFTASSVKTAFHFLPANVNRVIAIANYDNITVTDGQTNLADVINIIKFNVGDRQEQDNLPLYGQNGLTKIDAVDGNHNSNFYKSEITLLPRVARVEITDFEYTQLTGMKDDEEVALPRVYNKIQLNKVAVSNYYDGYTLWDGTPFTGSQVAGTSANQVATYLNGLTVTPSLWYYDMIGENLESTAYKYAAEGDDKALFAYTLPAGDLVPNIYLNMNGFTGNEDSEAESTPLNLVTLNLKAGNPAVALDCLEAGKIYRIHFKFNDNDLKLQGKCIDVKVTVSKWNVVAVTPEF